MITAINGGKQLATDTKSRHGGRRRPNGAGSLYKVETPAGVRFDIKYLDPGTGKRRTKRFKAERDAQRALNEINRRIERGLEPAPAQHTMKQLFDAWLNDLAQRVERGERSRNTLREYESYVRMHMTPALGAVDCRRLTVQAVDEYLGALKLAPKTRANHRIALRRALNVALKWGWVDRNVAQLTDPIPVQPEERQALSFEDAKRLLDAIKDDPLYSVYVVAIFTGLRAGELAGLLIEDIDLMNGRARIHQQVQPVKGEGLVIKAPKTFVSSARIDLIPPVLAVLAEQIGDRTEGFVWASEDGRPYWPTSFTHGLTRALKRAGLPHMRLHDLRHAYVSFFSMLDVDERVKQRLGRHATAQMTDRYTSILDGAKRDAMEQLYEALQGVPQAAV